ncbi:hypothetical protein JXO52_07980 [bacterium]|nr:hypothetical protein [bacterium]
MQLFPAAVQETAYPYLELPVPAIKRRLGYPSGASRLSEPFLSIFSQTLTEAAELITARAVYRYCRPKNRTGSVLTFEETDFYIESEKVAALLRESEYAVLFFATLGHAVCERVREYGAAGKLTEQLVLDAVASETADAVADRLHRQTVRLEAEAKGFRTTPRFSPGYGDWPLSVQAAFAAACEADRIGVSVDESSFMRPLKTVSAVFGLEKR